MSLFLLAEGIPMHFRNPAEASRKLPLHSLQLSEVFFDPACYLKFKGFDFAFYAELRVQFKHCEGHACVGYEGPICGQNC